jgi:tetratricopeptide (TPR) repeat protein
LNTGDYSQALPKARRALEIAQEMNDLLRQAKGNKVLGQVLLALGQTDEASTHLRDALEIAQSRQQTEMAAEIATILAPLERPEDQ